ncbi:hypothetical protein G6F24_018326 [Rhizopus arrhizus]|nr:hypothetical protein G6F24_018326 [Rhizopus arrhizus]
MLCNTGAGSRPAPPLIRCNEKVPQQVQALCADRRRRPACGVRPARPVLFGAAATHLRGGRSQPGEP